ncbi:MAG: hypothetical protein LBT40_16560 [Deltaproteobacteria bacterium]|jgi:hypothetical protein|nr:hypothetical protein [Deltaproteobacteria bacterium]
MDNIELFIEEGKALAKAAAWVFHLSKDESTSKILVPSIGYHLKDAGEATVLAYRDHYAEMVKNNLFRKNKTCDTLETFWTPTYSICCRMNLQSPNLLRCKMPWVCPYCNQINALEQLKYLRAFAKWVDAESLAVTFLTVTIPHKAGHSLFELNDNFDFLMKKLRNSGLFTKTRKKSRFNNHGSITKRKITWGKENGWHPSLQRVDAWNSVLTSDAINEYQEGIIGVLEDRLINMGLLSDSLVHSFREYGVKIVLKQGQALLNALEFISDIHTAFPYYNNYNSDAENINTFSNQINPIQYNKKKRYIPLTDIRTLAAKAAKEGKYMSHWVRLFHEYASATRNRRMTRWSNGLRTKVEPYLDLKT